MIWVVIAHAVIIGGAGIVWVGYGVYRRKNRWVVEGLLLTALVAVNTLAALMLLRR